MCAHGAWAAGGIPVLIDPRSGTIHFEHAICTVAPDSRHRYGPERPTSWCQRERNGRVSRGRAGTAGGRAGSGAASPGQRAGLDCLYLGIDRPAQGRDAVAREPATRLPCSDRLPRHDRGRPDPLHGPMVVRLRLRPAPVHRDAGSDADFARASNPIGMCEAIERHRPTVLAGVPSVFTYLLRGVSPFRTTDLSSIATVTNTGGTIPAPILEELFALLPHARFFLNYGLTESYRTSCLDPSLAKERRASIGKPIPGVDVAIVREDGSIAGPNEVGEIVHRGDYLFLGYWNDPDATAHALKPDPLAPAGVPGPPRALYTGDLGYLDEHGFLFFAGRGDNQLKSMGVRVGPADVEDLLYRSGLVKEAAVVGRKHEMQGDEVCAFVVPVDGVDNAVFQLGQYARRAMSPYMVPRRFFVVSELPKTPNRKVDYPALRRLAAGDAADRGQRFRSHVVSHHSRYRTVVGEP